MNNLTVCLYSTTKGHWGNKNRYLETIEDLSKHEINFFEKIAHIKISPGEDDIANWMEENFIKFGFRVIKTTGEWKHFSGSHAIQQLKDIFTVFNEVESNYILHLEDDWLLKPIYNNLEFWLNQAVELLKNNNQILQVRIPRHKSEKEHYKTLEKVDGNWYKQDEIYSLNPHIINRADLQIILNTVFVYQNEIISNLESQNLNIEILFAQLGRQLKNKYPFYSFSPENIRCLHIGTPIGEEDRI